MIVAAFLSHQNSSRRFGKLIITVTAYKISSVSKYRDISIRELCLIISIATNQYHIRYYYYITVVYSLQRKWYANGKVAIYSWPG